MKNPRPINIKKSPMPKEKKEGRANKKAMIMTIHIVLMMLLPERSIYAIPEPIMINGVYHSTNIVL